MSTSGKEITVEGHTFEIVTNHSGGVWSAEVVNAMKTAFAFDPTFESEEEAVAHVTDALLGQDISNFLG